MKFLLLFLFLSFAGMMMPNGRGGKPGGEEPTGSVSGKIEIRGIGIQGSAQRTSRNRSYGKPSKSPRMATSTNEFANVVVCLEGENIKSAPSPVHSRAVMDQQNAEFAPHVLPVQRGTVVEFINRDNVYHDVFSLSSVKKFNIGRRPTGQAVPVTFDKPGVAEIFCDIHSNMSAYVFVMENGFFVQPDKEGNYSIDHVPAGTYTIKVWHERLGTQERKITVVPNSGTTANFSLE